ncbi:MAG: ATP-binding protein [candidate division WOR-3 bacterium]
MNKTTGFEALLSDRGFLDEISQGVWVADAQGRVVFANRPLARILGYESEQALVGVGLRDLLPTADAEQLAGPKADADLKRRTCSTVLSRDRRPIPATVTVMRRTKGSTAWLIGIVTATDPDLPPTADWASRQVMENSADGICIIENNQITYVNRRLEELTEYSSPQLGRMTLDRLVSPRDRKTILQILAEPHRLLGPVHHEVRIVGRTGRESTCDMRVVPAEVKGRTLLICYLRDVSQLRQAERVRADFIAMVSHDLRTPLATIKEAISLLAETASSRLEARQQRYLAIAREEMDRLNRMIDNLIEVARMESGKLSLHIEGVDLAPLLSSAVESLALLISKKNLSIERSIPDRLPPVLADRDRLLRVVNNLLDNAIKYSPVGATISIEVTPVDPGASVLSGPGILANTAYVQVTITDSGPGIPAEFLDRIFGKFERVDPHGPGIGLGLAIVRSIIEMHHGRVWATSVLGEGASFHFVLPTKEN